MTDNEPISVKKLKQGDGHWNTPTEGNLGMVIQWYYEMHETPDGKSNKDSKDATENCAGKVEAVGKIGETKLMHTIIGIPNDCGLLSPPITIIATKEQNQFYKDKAVHLNWDTKQALQDWTTLLELANKQPTLCMDLIPALADYGGYVMPQRAVQVGSGLA